jgi:hypothetical protein
MVFTFYKARGLGVGSSLVEEDQLELAKKLEKIAKEKGVKVKHGLCTRLHLMGNYVTRDAVSWLRRSCRRLGVLTRAHGPLTLYGLITCWNRLWLVQRLWSMAFPNLQPPALVQP